MAANSQELRRICEVPQLASDVAPNRVKSKLGTSCVLGALYWMPSKWRAADRSACRVVGVVLDGGVGVMVDPVTVEA